MVCEMFAGTQGFDCRNRIVNGAMVVEKSRVEGEGKVV
jgi:hypothetical protein